MKLVFKLVLGFIVIPILFFIYYIYSEVSYNLSTADYIFFYTYPWISVYAWCMAVITKELLEKIFHRNSNSNFIYQFLLGNLMIFVLSVLILCIFEAFNHSIIRTIELYFIPLVYVCVICSIYYTVSHILSVFKRPY